MVAAPCIGRKPDGTPCQRARREPVGESRFAHCLTCERRLRREAWGPVAWHERARTHTLPTLVVGGVDDNDTAVAPAR